MEYNPNLYKRKPYAHVHRLFLKKKERKKENKKENSKKPTSIQN